METAMSFYADTQTPSHVRADGQRRRGDRRGSHRARVVQIVKNRRDAAILDRPR